MDWTFETGQPIYSQIVEQMRTRIAGGYYKSGDRLPSVRDLAAEAGVNPNTMQRALGEMERLGLLYSDRTRGRFVTGEEDTLKNLHTDLARQYVDEFFRKLEELGLSDEEIIKLVENHQSKD